MGVEVYILNQSLSTHTFDNNNSYNAIIIIVR